MKWYNYIAAFFSGAFFANVVPHFFHGVSGEPFPSPFASPPGVGLSSPWVNVLWACLNMVVGYILLRVSNVSVKNKLSLFIFFLGILTMSVMLSFSFKAR